MEYCLFEITFYACAASRQAPEMSNPSGSRGNMPSNVLVWLEQAVILYGYSLLYGATAKGTHCLNLTQTFKSNLYPWRALKKNIRSNLHGGVYKLYDRCDEGL